MKKIVILAFIPFLFACDSRKTNYDYEKSKIQHYFAMDDIKQADSLLSELFKEAYESDFDFFYYYALTSIHLGNYQRADSILEVWDEKSGEDYRIDYSYAYYYSEKGNYEKALYSINKSLALKSFDHSSMNLKGSILSNFEKDDSVFKEAKNSFERAYILFPMPLYKFNLSQLYSNYEIYDSSISILTNLIANDKENYEFYISRGASYYYKNKFKLAELDFIQADSINPISPSSKYHLGLIQLKNEDFENGCINILKCDSLGGHKDHMILLKQCKEYGWYD